MSRETRDARREQIRSSWSDEERSKRKAFSTVRQLQLECMLLNAFVSTQISESQAETCEEVAIAG